MYLQCPSNEPRTRTSNVVFYTICLLYVFCAAAVVSDIISVTVQVSNKFICKISFLSSVAQLYINSLSPQLQIDLQPIINHMVVLQATFTVCCDFTSQCILVRITWCCICHPFYSPKSSKIYRCWIVWGQKLHIVTIPSFLAITLIGQSISGYLYLISRFQFIASSYLDSVNCYWRLGIKL